MTNSVNASSFILGPLFRPAQATVQSYPADRKTGLNAVDRQYPVDLGGVDCQWQDDPSCGIVAVLSYSEGL